MRADDLSVLHINKVVVKRCINCVAHPCFLSTTLDHGRNAVTGWIMGHPATLLTATNRARLQLHITHMYIAPRAFVLALAVVIEILADVSAIWER